MMYDKMAPEDPIKEPTIVNKGLPSIKPSAHKAQPEYEFNTVIATGISAEPIEKMIFHPNREDVKQVKNKEVTPIGTDLVISIRPNNPRDAAPKGMFKYC